MGHFTGEKYKLRWFMRLPNKKVVVAFAGIDFFF
jgi:hypothetical protein